MLSVVIPTRNRSDLLRRALLSLAEQQVPAAHFEVLVVDNGSTDGTRDVALEFRDRFDELRYFFAPDPGLHVGRHVGFKEARGGLLAYLDDDVRVTPTWVATVSDCFRDPAVALVGGNNYPDFEGTPPSWLLRLWDVHNPSFGGQAITSLSVLKLADGRREVSPYLIWGCNFSIRRDVLRDAGGFHPDGVPQQQIRFRGDGETHVSRYVSRAGLVSLFDSGASVYHAVTKERMSMEYFRRRAFNQGVSDSYSMLRHAAETSFHMGMAKRAKQLLRQVEDDLRAFFSRDGELRQLSRIMASGYREGFSFHQKAYRGDAEVRAWVHRPDYF